MRRRVISLSFRTMILLFICLTLPADAQGVEKTVVVEA